MRIGEKKENGRDWAKEKGKLNQRNMKQRGKKYKET